VLIPSQNAEKALGAYRQAYSQKPTFSYEAEASALTTLSDKIFIANKNKEHSEALKIWKAAVDHHYEIAVEQFFNVLQFPGGWLVVCSDLDNEEECYQVRAVRKILMKKVC